MPIHYAQFGNTGSPEEKFGDAVRDLASFLLYQGVVATVPTCFITLRFTD